MDEKHLADLTDRFVNAPTWEAAKRLVESSPELLDESVSRLLLSNIRRHAPGSKEHRFLTDCHSVLSQCREHGVDHGFADRVIPPELKAILNQLRDPETENNPLLRKNLALEGLGMAGETSRPRIWAILQVYLANALMDMAGDDRGENIESAILAFQRALRVADPEKMPKEWGLIKANLGNAYKDRIDGDPTENLEIALGHFLDSLNPLKRHAPPAKWIKTMLSLGAAYQKRLAGDRNDNLKAALSIYSELLEHLDRRKMPEWWTDCINGMGVVYSLLTDGNRSDHFEKAISCFQQALAVRDRRQTPLDWAESMSNLGNAYFFRFHGDRNENLETAISCFQAVLEVIGPETAPEHWLAVMGNLGVAFIDRISGDRSRNLEKGISILNRVRRMAGNSDFMTRTRISISLGNGYYHRISGDRSENLEKALAFYNEAFDSLDRNEYPYEWAVVANNLGNAYLRRTNGIAPENREQSISHYLKALEVRTRERMPVEWAITTMNLAIAYTERINGSRAENFEKAIELHRQAFEVVTREEMPVEWARNMNNLGAAYIERIRGDREDNIERAILCYRQSLEIRKREVFPIDWAETANNLANIYLYRTTGARALNIEEAIALYNDVLTFRNRENLPEDWAETMHNLGVAWFNRRHGRREENLRRAAACYLESLEVRTRETMPEKWAKTTANLGNAYIHMESGDRRAHIEKGIECYKKALEIRTRPAFPVDWAETANNLGTAWSELFRLTGDPGYRDKAADALSNALEVHTIDGMPEGYRLTRRNLGIVHFMAKDWESALASFSECLKAGELLYRSGTVASARQSQLLGNRDASVNSAYCLAKLGRFHKAVEVIEKARTRSLAEALSLASASLEGIGEKDGEEFFAVRRRVAELEAEARRPVHEGSRDYPAISSELSGVRRRLDELVERVRVYAPEFMIPEYGYDDIRNVAVRLAHPLVYLFTTALGSLALIVPPNAETMTQDHAVWLDRFDEACLDGIIYRRNGEDRYLSGIVLGDENTLRKNLDHIWSVLTEKLVGPVVTRLNALGWNGAWLVSSGILELLPLNALAAEKCAIARAPCARVLHSILSKAETSDPAPSFTGVSNPLPSHAPLPLAQVEVGQIASMFRDSRILDGKEATPDNVGESMAHSNYLHFAAHGKFDVADVPNSAIALANGGRLTLRDMLSGEIDLSSVRMAVLSACQTGIVDFQTAPDEMTGMASGFLQAGVRGVVGTLWPVHDVSATLLLTRFYYCHIGLGLSPASALARAQVWLLEAAGGELADICEQWLIGTEGRDRNLYVAVRHFKNRKHATPFAHPYYWAGFAFSGV